jgi:hypothetical protein
LLDYPTVYTTENLSLKVTIWCSTKNYVLQEKESPVDNKTRANTEDETLAANANLDPKPKNKKQCNKGVENPMKPNFFVGPGNWEDEDMQMSNKLAKLEQTNERSCFDDDYILSQDDKEALGFIRHSYASTTVVDIDNIPLTVEQLKPHISNGWLFGDVSLYDSTSIPTTE